MIYIKATEALERAPASRHPADIKNLQTKVMSHPALFKFHISRIFGPEANIEIMSL